MAQSLQPFWGRGRVVRRMSPLPLAPLPNPLATAPSLPVLGALTKALFIPHGRSIGGIVADVTIEESGNDDVQITEHPVEQGAPIADHAFKRGAQLQIRAGWTAAHGNLSAEGDGVYGTLLSWQAALNPFDIYTGKRIYTHMLIERLTVTTDAQSEYVLMAQISCKEVIIVSTQTTEVASAVASPDPNAHDNPAATAPAQDNGDQPKTSPPPSAEKAVANTTNQNTNVEQLSGKGIEAPVTTTYDNIEQGTFSRVDTSAVPGVPANAVDPFTQGF